MFSERLPTTGSLFYVYGGKLFHLQRMIFQRESHSYKDYNAEKILFNDTNFNSGTAMKSLIQQICRPIQNYSLNIIIKAEGNDSEIGN